MPPSRHPRRTTRPGPYDVRDIADYNLHRQHHHLACPFCKRYPELHELIDGPCTKRWGFDSIRSLNEHLKRDHSLKFGCFICKKRFYCKESELEGKKVAHMPNCKPRDFASDDPVWMDADQETRWLNWDKGSELKRQDNTVKKYNGIYKSLFTDAEGALPTPYPSPFYDYLQRGCRARLEHLKLRISHHETEGFLAPSLATRVEAAIREAKRLESEVDNICVAIQNLEPDFEAVASRRAIPTQSRNQEADESSISRIVDMDLSKVDPQLSYNGTWSLDLDAAQLQEQQKYQGAVPWTNDPKLDSGYYSQGSSGNIRQLELSLSQAEISPISLLSGGLTTVPSHNLRDTESLFKGWRSNDVFKVGASFAEFAQDSQPSPYDGVYYGSDDEIEQSHLIKNLEKEAKQP